LNSTGIFLKAMKAMAFFFLLTFHFQFYKKNHVKNALQ
jgi:hypothetical protein